MADSKPVTFLERVERSGLVEEDQLLALLRNLKLHDRAGEKALADDVVANRLVETGLVTQWQCDRLMAGRYRGFFLGKYQLQDFLGGGGMSQVYLAEHILMRRRVAIKVLPGHLVEQSIYVDRFYQEVQAAALLNHHNIVRAFDSDKNATNGKDVHYLVMEFVDGRDLEKMVKEDGPLDVAVAVGYIRQAAEGLAHAHEHNMVHRDVKPANLMVDRRDVVKVLDLGLALLAEEKRALLAAADDNRVMGTADYLAPEQSKNSNAVDARADIYGLGCTLYYLLTGHPPFCQGTAVERIRAHQTQPPPNICRDRSDVPRDLVDICAKMMAKNPADRYPSAGEVAVVLAGWLAAHGRNGQSGSRSGSSSGGLAIATPASKFGSAQVQQPPTRPLPPKRRPPGDSASGISRPLPPIRKPQAGNSGVQQQKKRLLVAAPLDDSASEFVWGEMFAAPSAKRDVSGSGKQRSHRPGRRRSSSLPLWVWPAIGGGLLLGLVLLGSLIYSAM
jgi:eukaryotic-like serine/threonine-protein kinase